MFTDGYHIRQNSFTKKMLSTGNLQNYLRKLQIELRSIKFHDVDFKSFVFFFYFNHSMILFLCFNRLQIGSLCELLKIYYHIFLNYNPLCAKTLLEKFRCDFYGKTDRHFVDRMYEVNKDISSIHRNIL